MTLTLEEAPPERILLDMTWEGYEAMLEGIQDRHVFLTYDRGRLEIMSPSPKHSVSTVRVVRLLWIITEELGIPMSCFGDMTIRRKDLQRGLEPDSCFYLANESRVRGKDQLDFSKDPPPDLAIEVEISQRLLDRENIYAALGVPELWRYDGESIRFFIRREDASYRQVDRSPSFPQLPPETIERLLEMSRSMDDTSWAKSVRKWTQQNLRR